MTYQKIIRGDSAMGKQTQDRAISCNITRFTNQFKRRHMINILVPSNLIEY